MSYLGRQPISGNYQVLDAITATTTDTYALTKASVAVFPQTPSNCIVSLNGVIQAPVSSYTISGSNIVFDSALTGSDSINFITVLGDVLSIGTPTDGTVSLAKLSATGTKDATTFLRGDNTFASAGGGKVLQVVSVTWKDAFSSTAGSGSFVNITGATLAITPSSASSKIFFQSMITTGAQTYGVVLKIQRGGADISDSLGTVTGSRVASTAYSSGQSSDDAEMQSTYMSYLDSPSSTSALTYTVQGSARYQPAAVAWTVNYPYADTDANYTSHSVSTITLMEIGV